MGDWHWSCRLTAGSPISPGHGQCVCGMCQCEPDYMGSACECSRNTSACKQDGQECSGHGRCMCNQCVCNPGYFGSLCGRCPACRTPCEQHRYGPGGKGQGSEMRGQRAGVKIRRQRAAGRDLGEKGRGQNWGAKLRAQRAGAKGRVEAGQGSEISQRQRPGVGDGWKANAGAGAGLGGIGGSARR